MWRGSGMLKPFTCPCEVLDHDPECSEYAVVYFGKTPFTEDGIDIYSRNCADFPQERLDQILERLKASHPGAWAKIQQRELKATLKG